MYVCVILLLPYFWLIYTVLFFEVFWDPKIAEIRPEKVHFKKNSLAYYGSHQELVVKLYNQN